ncbi:DUF5819 family protein [Streptomyces sp. DSM 118148]|uniref:DUF5819 family protein n=1 Tax=Streptomyces sp. DSM 118148 TaxID=3448667 RepID=UPI00403FD0BB
MDAYDEDSHNRRGPDGSKGARLPESGTDGQGPPDTGVVGSSGPSAGGADGQEPPTGGTAGTESSAAASEGSEPSAVVADRGGDGSSAAGGDSGEQPTAGADAEESTAEMTDANESSAADADAGEPATAGADLTEAGVPGADRAAGGAGAAVGPPAQPRTGVAALSPRYQVGAAVALAAVAIAACVHLGMVFLSLAPANTVTKQHGKAIEDWVYPEFEQNWKLFAPNPLQQNIAVQVRAEVRTKDGDLRTTGWRDLSARDGAAIDGNLVPSHTQQNELRRAWDFLAATHGTDNRPVGLRGALSETYMRRIVVMRLYREDAIGRQGVVQRVQVRSRTTNVRPPVWSREQFSAKPVYRVLPWWTVTADEASGGVA